MAFEPINEDYPVGTVQAMNVVDNDLRNLKKGLRERDAVDHNRKADETGDSYIGYHKKVSFIDQTSDVSTYTQGGAYYTKSGEAYFRDKAGNVVPMTSGGQLVIGSNSHMISRGFELVYSSGTQVIVNPGTLYHNITQVNKTATTTLVLATGSDWIDGSAAASITSIPIYIYVNSSGGIKLEETAPAYADTAGNTAGKKIYHKESSTYWRWIGSVMTNSSDEIIKFYNMNDWIYYDDGITDCLVLNAGTQTSFTAQSCVTAIPATSQLASFHLHMGGVNNVGVAIRATGSSGVGQVFQNYSPGTSSSVLRVTTNCPTNSSQSIDYDMQGDTNVSIAVLGYYNPRN